MKMNDKNVTINRRRNIVTIENVENCYFLHRVHF